LIEASQASTARRLAGALRFKPLKRLDFIFGQALRRQSEDKLPSSRLEAARAKAKGVYAGKGRPSSIDEAQVREMKTQGLGATAIAKALGIGRASVYRVLEANSI